MRFLITLLVLMTVVLCCGCPAAICEQQATRCADDVAQVCNAQGQWQDVMDCSEVEPGSWTCGEDSEVGHTCNPVETP